MSKIAAHERTRHGKRILAWPRRIPLNPYFERLSDGLESLGWQVADFTYGRALAGRFDVLFIHFPTFPFRNRHRLIALARLSFAAALLKLARWRGKKIVWTVHNLASHERYHAGLEASYMSWFVRQVDLTVHLSNSGREAALERFPALGNRPTAVIPHFHYGDKMACRESRGEALMALGIESDATLLLMFGQLRRYKNVTELIEAFSGMDGRSVRLLVAGSIIDAGLEAEIRQSAHDPRVLLKFGAIPEGVLDLYMAAATLVVAPYRDILNSGTALFSLSHARPILVPDRGAMAELRANAGSEWVRLFQPPLRDSDLLAAVAWAEEPRMQAPILSAFAPDAIIGAHAKIFNELFAS